MDTNLLPGSPRIELELKADGTRIVRVIQHDADGQEMRRTCTKYSADGEVLKRWQEGVTRKFPMKDRATKLETMKMVFKDEVANWNKPPPMPKSDKRFLVEVGVGLAALAVAALGLWLTINPDHIPKLRAATQTVMQTLPPPEREELDALRNAYAAMTNDLFTLAPGTVIVLGPNVEWKRTK